MAEKESTVPEGLKPFIFHGLDPEYKKGEAQAKCECPFCGKQKMFINTETTQWDCKVCGLNGNSLTFIRNLWEKAVDGPYEQLLEDRRIIDIDSLKTWGVRQCPITGVWLFPGFNIEGKQSQLYRYDKDFQTGKFRLLATPGITHGIFGAHMYDNSKPYVSICEGPWDAIVLWETLKSAKSNDDGSLSVTNNEQICLLKDTNILAVPGCNVFQHTWAKLVAGKHTVLLFDSDHPKRNAKTNQKIPPVGLAGMKSVVKKLSMAEEKPEEVRFLDWGPDGYDPKVVTGYDVRDLLTTNDTRPLRTMAERVKRLEELLDKIKPIPSEWISGKSSLATKGTVDMTTLHCNSWPDLQNAWRKALRWGDGLGGALSSMLACIVSTGAVGDQLWMKIMGPAACGKSTLCEAISINKKHVIAKSTIRGFHSGYQLDRGDNKDFSLISKLAGKTLVTKDGDTLLQSPNISQILSEARDLYDRVARADYRNGVSRDYQGVNITWILCGTSSLRALDQSELGERFIDWVIMDRINDELEDEILCRVVNRAYRNMGIESTHVVETQTDPDLTKAMQLTGGYISYLRDNAQKLLNAVKISDKSLMDCAYCGKFAAFMRARPSKKQEETGGERELGSRLASQFTRYAICSAVAMGKKEVDDEVMKLVRKSALDTSRGITLDIVRNLYEFDRRGLSAGNVALRTDRGEDKQKTVLSFLNKIEVVEFFDTSKSKSMAHRRIKWRLTPKLQRLYSLVTGDKDSKETKDAAKKS